MIKATDTESFIEKSKSIHGDKYDYSKTVYTKSRDKVIITCFVHGDFEQRASHHYSGIGCKRCGIEKNKKRLTDNTDVFISKAKDIHGDVYEYSLVDYKKSNIEVEIICKIHGVFKQKPNKHLRGYGCYKCGLIKSGKSRTKNLIDLRFKYIVQPKDYKLIPLDNGCVAKVDNDDFDKLKIHNWCLTENGYCFNGKLGRMHRYIMNTPEGMHTDHINHDTLDNRKCNLRICTNEENNWNRLVYDKGYTSKYKGVSWCKITKKWFSYINYNNKRHNLGYYNDEVDAAKAYDSKAKEFFKEFALTNF